MSAQFPGSAILLQEGVGVSFTCSHSPPSQIRAQANSPNDFINYSTRSWYQGRHPVTLAISRHIFKAFFHLPTPPAHSNTSLSWEVLFKSIGSHYFQRYTQVACLSSPRKRSTTLPFQPVAYLTGPESSAQPKDPSDPRVRGPIMY